MAKSKKRWKNNRGCLLTDNNWTDRHFADMFGRLSYDPVIWSTSHFSNSFGRQVSFRTHLVDKSLFELRVDQMPVGQMVFD
jgi:hypothetical protein